MADLEALKRAAEAASITRVTWFADDTAPGEVLAMSDDIGVSAVARVNPAAEWVAATEAAWTDHIALANPATILDLISRLEEAEKALEPFANRFGDDVPRPDSMPLFANLTLGDFRRASAAYARLKGGTDEG